MAHSEILAERVRDALAGAPRITEKRMFGGIAFMVNRKMCVTVGKDRIMVRVDPAAHDKLVQEKGASPMVMRGREFKGYIRISETVLKTKRDLDSWVARALAFNEDAKRSKK
jgi:TfoX/Sxy family transcriptional regulator of competence genes